MPRVSIPHDPHPMIVRIHHVVEVEKEKLRCFYLREEVVVVTLTKRYCRFFCRQRPCTEL
jgi:hypothetical protein